MAKRADSTRRGRNRWCRDIPSMAIGVHRGRRIRIRPGYRHGHQWVHRRPIELGDFFRGSDDSNQYSVVYGERGCAVDRDSSGNQVQVYAEPARCSRSAFIHGSWSQHNDDQLGRYQCERIWLCSVPVGRWSQLQLCHASRSQYDFLCGDESRVEYNVVLESHCGNRRRRERRNFGQPSDDRGNCQRNDSRWTNGRISHLDRRHREPCDDRFGGQCDPGAPGYLYERGRNIPPRAWNVGFPLEYSDGPSSSGCCWLEHHEREYDSDGRSEWSDECHPGWSSGWRRPFAVDDCEYGDGGCGGASGQWSITQYPSLLHDHGRQYVDDGWRRVVWHVHWRDGKQQQYNR